MPADDMKIRLPRDLKEWLKARAGDNCRSMNGEVLALLMDLKRLDAKRVRLSKASGGKAA